MLWLSTQVKSRKELSQILTAYFFRLSTMNMTTPITIARTSPATPAEIPLTSPGTGTGLFSSFPSVLESVGSTVK